MLSSEGEEDEGPGEAGQSGQPEWAGKTASRRCRRRGKQEDGARLAHDSSSEKKKDGKGRGGDQGKAKGPGNDSVGSGGAEWTWDDLLEMNNWYCQGEHYVGRHPTGSSGKEKGPKWEGSRSRGAGSAATAEETAKPTNERVQPAEAGTISESVSREPWPEEGKLLQAVLEKERAGHDAAYWEAERAAWSRLEGLEVGRHEAQGDRKGPKGGAAKGQGKEGKAAQGAKDHGGQKGGRGRGLGGDRKKRRGAAPGAAR